MPNNWLRWWWHWRLLWSPARSHRPSAKERHPCSAGWLECKDRRGCKQELEEDMQPILQPWDQRKGLEAPRICHLQQPEGGEHINFGPHKPSRRWTWHSPGGDYHNQIDYIVVERRFQSSVNIAKTKSFPGADIGSGHELVMTTFRLCLQRVKNQGSIRIRFSLEKLKDPNIADFFFFFFFFFFLATIGGKCAPLLALENQDAKQTPWLTALTLPWQNQPTTSLANTDQQRSPGSRITY